MTKKQTFGFIGGAAVVAIGVIAAVNYSSANKGWPTQGAIGQREVYRDNAAKPEDVAVAPGSSPVADQANHQLKRSDLTSGMKSDAVSSQMASSVMAFMTSNASDAAKLQLAADFMSSSSSFAAFTQSNRVMNAVQSHVVANAVKSDAVEVHMRRRRSEGFAERAQCLSPHPACSVVFRWQDRHRKSRDHDPRRRRRQESENERRKGHDGQGWQQADDEKQRHLEDDHRARHVEAGPLTSLPDVK